MNKQRAKERSHMLLPLSSEEKQTTKQARDPLGARRPQKQPSNSAWMFELGKVKPKQCRRLPSRLES